METKFNIGDKALVEVEIKQIYINKQGIQYLVRPVHMHNCDAEWAHLEQEISEKDIIESKPKGAGRI